MRPVALKENGPVKFPAMAYLVDDDDLFDTRV